MADEKFADHKNKNEIAIRYFTLQNKLGIY